MPFQPEESLDYEDGAGSIQKHALFEEHCLNVLGRLRNIRLVSSFNDDLDQLRLNLDNIKLRFVIWVRSTHSLRPKNEMAVFELLTRLDLFLLHESETIRFSGGYGMIYDIDSHASLHDVSEYTNLEKGFRAHLERYLEKKWIDTRIESTWNSWIISDGIQCKDFLTIIDSMIDDLYSNTLDDMTLALAISYTSSIIGPMKSGELLAVQESAFSSGNILAQAAGNQLSRLGSTRRQMTGEATGEASSSRTTSTGKLLIRDDYESGLNPSQANQKSKEGISTLTVEERFAAIVEKCNEVQNNILQQDRPISKLAQRRVMAELRQADRESYTSRIVCLNSDLSDLLGIIRGPPDTAFEDGIFFIKIGIPEQYPMQPADFRFLTRIYHPNIDMSGKVCVKVADKIWSVCCSLEGLLASIISLLATPYPDDPLLPAAAQHYKENRKLFDHTAREWVKAHACKDWPAELPLPKHNESMISDKLATSASKAKAREISEDWVDLDEFVRKTD